MVKRIARKSKIYVRRSLSGTVLYTGYWNIKIETWMLDSNIQNIENGLKRPKLKIQILAY
jgi:hypothetical protein